MSYRSHLQALQLLRLGQMHIPEVVLEVHLAILPPVCLRTMTSPRGVAPGHALLCCFRLQSSQGF